MADEDDDWGLPAVPQTRKPTKRRKPVNPMAGRKHDRAARYKMSKRKQGRRAIYNGAGEIRFVSEEDCRWLCLAEGWTEGNCRARGRPKKA